MYYGWSKEFLEAGKRRPARGQIADLALDQPELSPRADAAYLQRAWRHRPSAHGRDG
jgi:hypothetical protein